MKQSQRKALLRVVELNGHCYRDRDLRCRECRLCYMIRTNHRWHFPPDTSMTEYALFLLQDNTIQEDEVCL